jgi:hypothetical protein
VKRRRRFAPVVFALAILPSSIEAAKAARVGPKVGLRGLQSAGS